MSKKRKYLDMYIEFGFTSIMKHRQESPQCVVCYKVLGEGSMKLSFLRRHFSSCHPELDNKGATYFKRLEVGVKRAHLDQSCQSAKSSKAPGFIHSGFENCPTEETTQHWREAHPSMLRRYCSVHDWDWC